MVTIGIDASRANKEEKTGVEWYAFFVIEHLKKIETPEHVRFILYSDSPLKGELSHLPQNWESKVLSWPPKRLWTHIRLSSEMLTHPPDVLFIPAHVFPIIHPKKTVMVVHDIAAAVFPESYSPFERWYSLFSARFSVQKLWKTIVPSESTKDELQRTFGSKQSISVVPHGVDPRYKRITPSDAILQKYGIQEPFFLSVGRLEAKKNTHRIISAFDAFSKKRGASHRLVLIGKPGYGYEKVEAALKKSPYRSRILTPGWVSPDDIVHILSAAQALVFPSLYEGFGLPILEAFSCGTPVITSSSGAMKEISGGYAQLVEPLDVQGIAATLERVVDEQSDMSEVAHYTSAFSWENCAKKTCDVLLSGW